MNDIEEYKQIARFLTEPPAIPGGADGQSPSAHQVPLQKGSDLTFTFSSGRQNLLLATDGDVLPGAPVGDTSHQSSKAIACIKNKVLRHQGTNKLDLHTHFSLN